MIFKLSDLAGLFAVGALAVGVLSSMLISSPVGKGAALVVGLAVASGVAVWAISS